MTEKTITISVEEYERLLQSDYWLSCLEAAGVDNWSGIEFAYEIKHEDEDEDE